MRIDRNNERLFPVSFLMSDIIISLICLKDLFRQTLKKKTIFLLRGENINNESIK